MIATADLQKIIEVALFSGRLKDERPLSLLIIAVVGAGKSDLIAHYPETFVPNIIYANDITAFVLHNRYGKALKEGKIRHILMPDLLTALNRQKEQAEHFVTFMNGIIEEGLARVESRDSKFQANYPVRCGFITSIAKKDFERRRDKWATVGFLSRMLPVSYAYSSESVNRIFDFIMRGEYRNDRPIKLSLPTKDIAVTLSTDIAEQIKEVAIELKDPEDDYGFRRLKQLQSFVMGHALSCGRTQVSDDDLRELKRLKPFMRRDCKAMV